MTTKLQTALIVLTIFACGMIVGLGLGSSGTETTTATEPAQTVTHTVTRPVVHHAHKHKAASHPKVNEPAVPEPSAAEQAVEANPELVEGEEK